MRVTGEDMQLYAVTDTQWLNGKDFLSVIESVLANGATFLFFNLVLPARTGIIAVIVFISFYNL